MALGSTQPLTEEYQEYFLGGKGGRRVELTILPPLCADCLEILGNLGGLRTCTVIPLLFRWVASNKKTEG
jgi:hypothetical protein